jgi:hypothetical protein
MSYLSFPRLHFAGTFTADPSTIKNALTNFDAGAKPRDLSWNPYGSHAWTISARVTSFLDSRGKLYRDGDPLLGATIESYIPCGQAAASMPDPDDQQQRRTRLYGLYLRLVTEAPPADGGLAALTMLEAHFMDRATLLNLWIDRVPAEVNTDTGSGGGLQSVLEDLIWQASSSPLLDQLRQASPDELSIRLSCYGYLSDHTNPGSTGGSIVGTIDPWRRDTPKFHGMDRMTRPAPGTDPWSTRIAAAERDTMEWVAEPADRPQSAWSEAGWA